MDDGAVAEEPVMRYIPPANKSVTIDYRAIENNMERWASLALTRALDETADIAKKYAPVRNIFGPQGKGPSDINRRPAEAVPRGIMHRNGKTFGRKIRHYSAESQQRFLDQVHRQTKPNREYRAPSFAEHTGEYVGTYRVRGNARTWRPVVRRANGTVSTGRFRNAEIRSGKAQMAVVTAEDIGSRKHRTTTGAEYLSGRGRWELERANKVIEQFQSYRAGKGRRRLQDREMASMFGGQDQELGAEDTVEGLRMSKEKFHALQESGRRLKRPTTALHMGATGTLTLGGRLRDEIFADSIKQTSRGYEGDVISPTYYAKFQEYGTSRHRAQPFMRPALYEMRKRLPEIVKQTMRNRV